MEAILLTMAQCILELETALDAREPPNTDDAGAEESSQSTEALLLA